MYDIVIIGINFGCAGFVVFAARTIATIFAFRGASRDSIKRPFAVIVSECLRCFLFDDYFFADGAMLSFRQTCLRASGRHSCIDHFRMTFCGDHFRDIIFSARASLLLQSGCRAGCRCNDYPFTVLVRVCGFLFGILLGCRLFRVRDLSPLCIDRHIG